MTISINLIEQPYSGCNYLSEYLSEFDEPPEGIEEVFDMLVTESNLSTEAVAEYRQLTTDEERLFWLNSYIDRAINAGARAFIADVDWTDPESYGFTDDGTWYPGIDCEHDEWTANKFINDGGVAELLGDCAEAFNDTIRDFIEQVTAQLKPTLASIEYNYTTATNKPNLLTN
jgi:hypothetical protein